MERELDRRTFLALSSVAGAAAIAGCSGGDNGDTTTDPGGTATDTESPTETTTTTEPSDDQSSSTDIDPTDTESALIEPATLQEWLDAGIVNTDDVYEDRVVILRVDTGNYSVNGHIPNAVKMATDDAEGPAVLTETRLDGLGETQKLVASGSVVDQILQNAGVGPNTTIVLSGEVPMYNARTYWTLRYWGFPRERIKVLNGGPTAYADEVGSLTGETPETPETGYTVEGFEETNYALREGLNEMLQLVDDKNAGESDASILDLRGPDQDAKIAGSTLDAPDSYTQGGFTESVKWKPADEIEDHVFGYEDIEDGDPIVTLCHSGFKGTLAFFALDGILGYDNVSLYDGSWKFQWKQYNGNQDPTPNDLWRTDMHERTDGEITATDLVTIDSDLSSELDELATLDANQVKRDDLNYLGASGGDFGCGS